MKCNADYYGGVVDGGKVNVCADALRAENFGGDTPTFEVIHEPVKNMNSLFSYS